MLNRPGKTCLSPLFRNDDTEMCATGTVLDEEKSRLVFLVGQTGDIRIDNVKLSAVVN